MIWRFLKIGVTPSHPLLTIYKNKTTILGFRILRNNHISRKSFTWWPFSSQLCLTGSGDISNDNQHYWSLTIANALSLPVTGYQENLKLKPGYQWYFYRQPILTMPIKDQFIWPPWLIPWAVKPTCDARRLLLGGAPSACSSTRLKGFQERNSFRRTEIFTNHFLQQLTTSSPSWQAPAKAHEPFSSRRHSLADIILRLAHTRICIEATVGVGCQHSNNFYLLMQADAATNFCCVRCASDFGQPFRSHFLLRWRELTFPVRRLSELVICDLAVSGISQSIPRVESRPLSRLPGPGLVHRIAPHVGSAKSQPTHSRRATRETLWRGVFATIPQVQVPKDFQALTKGKISDPGVLAQRNRISLRTCGNKWPIKITLVIKKRFTKI